MIMEIQDLLNQLGYELKKQQDNNDSRTNYLFNENQQLKNTLKKQKKNLIELAMLFIILANSIKFCFCFFNVFFIC